MKKQSFLLFAILLVAFYLRFEGIRWGLPSHTLTLATNHPDEAYLFQVFEHMLQTRSLHPGTVGLLYGTLYFYMSGFFLLIAKIFGFISIGSREFLLQNLLIVDRMYLIPRIFSCLCGGLSVWGVYSIARRVCNERTALFAAFFLACMPGAIAVSHYAKVDALLMPLAIALASASLDLWENPQFKNGAKAGFMAGLLASTKYNAGIFILVPLSVVGLLLYGERKLKLKESALVIGSIFGFALIGFIGATPYALLDFSLFISCLKTQMGMLGGSGIWEVLTPHPFWRYANYYLPFGVGWISFTLFIFSLPVLILRRRVEEFILFLAFLFYFLLISFAQHKLVSFLAPILPFIAIFSGIAVSKIAQVFSARFLKVFFVGLLLLGHACYGFSFARLYSPVDTRDQASVWIKGNIPVTRTIGVIRSYFWTPGLLRQKNPPYSVLKLGDDQSSLNDAILGLSNFKEQGNFFVVSELETREYSRVQNLQSQSSQLIDKFFVNYEKIQTFEKKPTLFGFSLWKRTPPWDFSMISPAIAIYRKKGLES